ncbi:MAG TPA: cyclopropane-fatty-acyl-phospholipid synthase family protein [Blastocatellia bacterium]|nr:cyclopropane-fatty-acyl-phospholipid synthase family protein [Blastocatellia bacterium]
MEDRTSVAAAELPVVEKGWRICQRIFDRILSTLPAGKLRVVLPDGKSVAYGLKMPGPEATLKVLRPAFFKKCILYGEVGLGESYMDGDWESDDVVGVLSWFIINLEHTSASQSSKRRLPLTDLLLVFNRLRHKLRANTRAGARRNISEHYDLGNDFYRLFLDPGMTYSCGYFNSPELSLEEAQTAKYDRLCRKLKLSSSDHVLEIGGGWGGFAVHAARHYGCRVTSITISKEQWEYAKERIAAAGLSHQIDFQLTDYRNVTGKFDRIVSIEMIEAVGHEYFRSFFSKCHELLNRYGLLGIQAITCPDSRYESHRRNVTWMQKHIFPGGLLPSIGVMNRMINETGDLQLHGLEEMGLHYARTVATWRENFRHKLEAVLAQGFDERFIRKWNYYLLNCEAAFRTRNITVVQAIWTRPNNLTI